MTVIPLYHACESCGQMPGIAEFDGHLYCAVCVVQVELTERMLVDLQERFRQETLPAFRQVVIEWAANWADAGATDTYALIPLVELTVELMKDELKSVALTLER